MPVLMFLLFNNLKWGEKWGDDSIYFPSSHPNIQWHVLSEYKIIRNVLSSGEKIKF
jgi:hypothetical protein